jgi:predicted dehydrogenase
METLRVGFIGTGDVKEGFGNPEGFFMAYFHHRAYARLPNIEFAACADLVRERAEKFASFSGTKAVYTDYREMLHKEKLDLVSICTWSDVHTEMVVSAAEAGVKGIHCEKPMSATWSGVKKMLEVAKARGSRLTINHQRRYGDPFVKVYDVLKSGELGTLQRIEGACPNLWDWGDHFGDLFHKYVDEAPAEWAMGQIDYRTGDKWFGMPVEDQGLFQIRYQNGVDGFIFTAQDCWKRAPLLRLLCTNGVIERRYEQPNVRWRLNGARDWEAAETEDRLVEVNVHGKKVAFWEDNAFEKCFADMVDSLRTGRDCQIKAENAIRGQEDVYACYESVRRRSKVTLPIDIEDHPFLDLVQRGVLGKKA